MRVVITGGSGMVGRPLAEELANAGHEVVVLTRSPERVVGLAQGVRAVGWDGRTSAGWVDMADGAGAIVNLASENIAGDNLISILFGKWTAEKKRRIVQSRSNAGSAVVEAVAAARRKPSVVVQISGTGYYGVTNPNLVDEDSPQGSDFLAQVCESWEAATEPVEAAGVRRVVLRSAVVLSRSGGVLPVMLLQSRLLVGGPLGGGRQPFSWVHLADVAGAIRFAIENDQARGVLNLAAPEIPTNAEFSRLLGNVIHRPCWLPAPAFAMRLLLGEKATIVLDGQRPSSERLMSLGYRFRFAEARAALEDLLR